jgi:hypothetical protein
MTLPPLWKVKRELDRIRVGVWRAWRGALIEPPRQWLYDRHTEKHQHPVTGRAALTQRVVVLVLFQPKGLASSVQLTLDHLVAQGWSVVVVSNAPLSIRDAAIVTDRAALLLERPNVGYDFGGYRAGLRLLAHLGHRPERLILINDSTWFPLREGDDTLHRMEALGAAMAGQIFRAEQGRGRDHLESHLLMFSPEALAHPVWARFWNGFVMSDDRVTTILRGEKGLSQALMSAGLRVVGLIGRESFLTCLDRLTDPDLRNVMADVVHHRPDAQAYCVALSQSDAWRAGFLEWVNGVLANSRQHLVSVTFVAPAMQLRGMGFVKKTRDRRFHLARIKVLELEAAGRIVSLHPAVRAEIAAAVAEWTPPTE